jgi:hypothetical protein
MSTKPRPRKHRLPRSDPIEADPSDPRQLALDLGPPDQAPGASDNFPMGGQDGGRYTDSNR